MPHSPTKLPRRIGLYGGTFDPVHHGHLIGARDILDQCALDQVIWIPCAQSPHKKARTVVATSAADRLAMVRRAIRGRPGFSVSDVEIHRQGLGSDSSPSYTIDTVLAFRARFPDAKLFWLMGADQLSRLSEWHRVKELRKLVTFLVINRDETPITRLPSGVISLPRPRRIDISATEIRARVKENLPIDHLVPPAVAGHIARRGLYLSCLPCRPHPNLPKA